MNSIYGWTGKILIINLTEKKYKIEDTCQYKDLIGGKGINQLFLFNNIPVNCDAFDPENAIVIGAGPLVGTLSPTACRLSIDTKNALTGGTSSSNCGGHFAAELKYSGFDNVVINGKSDKLCYIFINNGKVIFKDARKYKGLTTWETEKKIRRDLNDERIKVISIGPAGENLLRTAAIVTENGRVAGKGGVGGVIGSKNIKAIAVRGNQSILVHDKNYIKKIVKFYHKLSGKDFDALRLGGTHGAIFEPANNRSAMPVRNNQEEYWDPEKTKKVSQEIINKLGFEKLRIACFGCPLYCSHFYDIGDFKCEGFENTNAMALGPKMDIDDPRAIIKLHGLSNAYGIDTDCVGTEIAWAMELFERGIIDERDTDGLILNWGNYRSALKLLERIVYKKGFGALFADGIKVAAEKIGRNSIYYASHIKGEDVYEPMRAKVAWGMGIALAPKGGGHCEGAPVTEGLGLSEKESMKRYGVKTAGKPFTYDGKPELIKWHEQFSAAINSLGMCYLASMWTFAEGFSPKDYAELFSITTGEKLTEEQFLDIGLKVHNIEKSFNVLHTNFSKKDDFPPDRYFEEELNVGPCKGKKLDREKWSQAITHYYKIHGWDPNTGIPKEDTLRKLGLNSVLKKLKSYKKIK